jgi:hypothetical protein
MSGSLAPLLKNGVSQVFVVMNRQALKLSFPNATNAGSKLIQAARDPAKKIVAGGVGAFTLYTTGIQLKDNYDDYDAKKITALEASLGAGAALCGLVSGFSGSSLVAFGWAHANSMLTAAKYMVGGGAAMKDTNNQIDFLNRYLAMISIAQPGMIGTAAGIANGSVTAHLSNTHKQVSAAVSSKLNENCVLPQLASTLSDSKGARLTLLVTEGFAS